MPATHSGILTYRIGSSATTFATAEPVVRCVVSSPRDSRRGPVPGTAGSAVPSRRLCLTAALHYGTIRPPAPPSVAFRRGTSLGLARRTSLDATHRGRTATRLPGLGPRGSLRLTAHLGHLPRTARPRASSLARAESGRARGAPDARGGPTAAHDIKGTPTISPPQDPERAHTYRPVGGGRPAWFTFGPILNCGAVVKSSLYINNRQPYGSLST